MQDVKKEIHLHYEEKMGHDGVIKVLKDQDGEVRFMKIGFGSWEKIGEDSE